MIDTEGDAVKCLIRAASKQALLVGKPTVHLHAQLSAYWAFVELFYFSLGLTTYRHWTTGHIVDDPKRAAN